MSIDTFFVILVAAVIIIAVLRLVHSVHKKREARELRRTIALSEQAKKERYSGTWNNVPVMLHELTTSTDPRIERGDAVALNAQGQAVRANRQVSGVPAAKRQQRDSDYDNPDVRITRQTHYGDPTLGNPMSGLEPVRMPTIIMTPTECSPASNTTGGSDGGGSSGGGGGSCGSD